MKSSMAGRTYRLVPTVPCLREDVSCFSSGLLDAVSEHFSDKRLPGLGIKHCVKQVDFRPVQLQVSLDEGGAISVDCVDVHDCLFLGSSRSDQPLDLRRAGSIEKYPKHILAIAKKILRAPANDYAWSAGKCVIDGLFRNDGDTTSIQQFQTIGWRQCAFECSSKERLKDAIDRRIPSPFPLLDRLRRAMGQPRDFLS